MKQQIKSYVPRQGRMSKVQKNALSADFSNKYIATLKHITANCQIKSSPPYLNSTLTQADILDLLSQYPNQAPINLEIGFGNGQVLLEQAKNYPKNNFLGIEVHLPGISRLIINAHRLGLNNLKILRLDAKRLLNQTAVENIFNEINILFPDPWHKKQHHKRRLLDNTFIHTLTNILQKNGRLNIATDWQEYAAEISKMLNYK